MGLVTAGLIYKNLRTGKQDNNLLNINAKQMLMTCAVIFLLPVVRIMVFY